MPKFFDRSVYDFLWLAFFALCGFNSASAQSPGKPLALPVRYDEHRFYVQPVTAQDDVTLNLFTDTGGGLFLNSDVVERLKLPLLKSAEKDVPDAVMFPPFKPNFAIPSPLGSNERLFVMSVGSGKPNPIDQNWSGMLGQQWFARRTWTFDYPKRQLLLRADGDMPKQNKKHQVALGFQTNPAGERAADFPRIQISVDGETINLLFDTGASTALTDPALAALDDKRPAIRATSFITASVFERWRAKHPDWRVIENAEKMSGQAMIEVPKVSVAGYAVGPVWFTRRPDKNFHEFMSQWMDKRVEGALGGNALHFFRITIDYPRAVAVFEK